MRGSIFFILLGLHSISNAQQIRSFLMDDVAETIQVNGYPDWIELNKGSAWIANDTLNLMQCFDVKSNTLTHTIAVNKPCAAFTIGFGSLWTMSCGEHALQRFDIVSGKLKASIPMTLADNEGSIVAAADAVWVLSDEKGVLSRVDPKTNSVVAKVHVRAGSYAVMGGYGAIWVTNTKDGSVERIDPAENRVVANIRVGKQPRFLTLGEGGIWTLNQEDGSVTRIDPRTNKAVAHIECGVPGTGGDISAGEGYVWVRAKKVMLLAIDPKSNKVVATFGPLAGSGAVRAGDGYVWVSAHDVNKVWKLKPSMLRKQN
jgi:virginiamycin B lyase